jgi:integrase
VRFGTKPFTAITGDDVEQFLFDLKARGRAASTRNQYLQLVKSLFRWATKKGYIAPNPIAASEVRREKIAKRSRRLQVGEEAALLAACNPILWRLVVGALETCCRAGELLKLQWQHIDLVCGEIRVVAANAKDGEDCYLPISTRLRAVLDMVRHDPAGRLHGPRAFVFGNELGEAVSFPRRRGRPQC